MSRIPAAFANLKTNNRRAFIPFITAGDPDLQATAQLLREFARADATVIELGVPFSDPVADGPVVQRASERALRHGFGVAEILEVAAVLRDEVDVPIVLFSYYNPLMQYGVQQLARRAKDAGIDGILVTDLPPEESEEFAAILKANELDMIFLVAPTTSDERLQAIAAQASGFIYAVSRRGVTGVRETVSDEAETLVNRVREFSRLPVAVGFGISSAAQVADTWRYADGAVVGSAIVAEIERSAGRTDFAAHIGTFARSLIPSIEN